MDDAAVRPMEPVDIEEARAVFQLAFGTFVGHPDPARWSEDRDLVGFRWRMDPQGAFVAHADGRLIGSNFAVNWGSVGFVGPLTVHPDYWNRGIAQQLLKPAIEIFDNSNMSHVGLFTFADSPKHLELYRRFGFWPRFQCAIMTKNIADPPDLENRKPEFGCYSELGEADRKIFLSGIADLTLDIYPGLDLSREVAALEAEGLGETVFTGVASRPDGFAICHYGRGSEAGEGWAFVKFAAARSAEGAAERFEDLLIACETLAGAKHLALIEASTSLARDDAYARMIARGFEVRQLGINMHRDGDPGYHRPGVYAIDDWR